MSVFILLFATDESSIATNNVSIATFELSILYLAIIYHFPNLRIIRILVKITGH